MLVSTFIIAGMANAPVFPLPLLDWKQKFVDFSCKIFGMAIA